MGRFLVALAVGALAIAASPPAGAGESVQVEALVVDAPSERPGYRMRAVVLKNLGERSVRLLPEEQLMAPAPEPETCGRAPVGSVKRRLRPGAVTVIPLLLYPEGSTPGSDDPLLRMDSYVATTMLAGNEAGACEAALVWTSNTLGTPAFTLRGEQGK